MAEAKSRYQILSMEPSPERMAEIMRDAEIERRLDRAYAYAEGYAEGLAEVRAEGARDALRFALRARFGELSERGLARIADADLARLAGWAARLHLVTSVDELFAD